MSAFKKELGIVFIDDLEQQRRLFDKAIQLSGVDKDPRVAIKTVDSVTLTDTLMLKALIANYVAVLLFVDRNLDNGKKTDNLISELNEFRQELNSPTLTIYGTSSEFDNPDFANLVDEVIHVFEIEKISFVITQALLNL